MISDIFLCVCVGNVHKLSQLEWFGGIDGGVGTTTSCLIRFTPSHPHYTYTHTLTPSYTPSHPHTHPHTLTHTTGQPSVQRMASVPSTQYRNYPSVSLTHPPHSHTHTPTHTQKYTCSVCTADSLYLSCVCMQKCVDTCFVYRLSRVDFS